MFCIKCGTKIEEGTRFCPECGAPIEAGPAVAPGAGSAVVSPAAEDVSADPPATETVAMPAEETVVMGGRDPFAPIDDAEFAMNNPYAGSSGSRVCPSCGAPVPAGMNFCTECGTRLDGATAATVAMPVTVAAPAASASTAASEKPKKKVGAWVYGLIVVVAAAVVIVIGLFATGMTELPGSASTDETTEVAETDEGSSASSDDSDDDAVDPVVVVEDDDSDKSVTVEVEKEEDAEEETETESGYVLADSDSRYYTTSELSSLSDWELYIARNEIYARHGRGFNTEVLQDYFDSQDWYVQIYTAEEFDNIASSVLNDYEKTNAATIREVEENRNSAYI